MIENCDFKGTNSSIEEDNGRLMPVHFDRKNKGALVSCIKISFFERLKILIFGRVWVRELTFNDPVAPREYTTDTNKVKSWVK